MIGLGVSSGGVMKPAGLGDHGTNGEGIWNVPGQVPRGGDGGVGDGMGEGVWYVVIKSYLFVPSLWL